MPVRFTDNIDRNLDIIRDLLTELSEPQRQKVRAVASAVNELVQRISKENPKDPVAGLGVAYATHYIAQRMTQKSQDGQDTDSPLIQLLS
jgi:hypothetical protein